METSKDLIAALSLVYELTGASTPPEDPRLAEAVDLARATHRALGWLVIRPEDGVFTVRGEPVPAREGDEARFREALTRARITEIRLQEPLPSGALLDFCERLHACRKESGQSGSARFSGLPESIGLSFRRGDPGPLGMASSVERLFRRPGAEGTGERATPEGDGAQGSCVGAPPQLPDLRALAGAFHSASGEVRASREEAIMSVGARLVEARDLESLADLLEALAEEPETGGGDRDALELAGQLMTRDVAQRIVARLGSTRDEEERNRLMRVSSRLGREMAQALAGALGEARDRFQRRTFLEAMLAHGDAAREMAEGMVRDPRWYVVRNGVALLRECGGEDALPSFMDTLPHEDPRVRKETVLALANLGGPDASVLLLEMIHDSDPEVRARACWALGVLRVEPAVRPLIKRLDGESDREVQVQCLQALGKIGDPGAVPFIEKKAVKRLFSRPSTEVRMAAYRALAAIGTPHARSLILKATRDSNLEVRKLAVGLMD
jgi:HEAT repeat protein